MTDLTTTYLGLPLANPLVPSATPLAYDLDAIRRMEDAGAAAIVLPSLFEEQLADPLDEPDPLLMHGIYAPAAPPVDLPRPTAFCRRPLEYLEHIRRVRQAVAIPVMASLNGVSRGGWTTYAHAIQQAGADALELNVYFLPTDPFLDGAEIEQEVVDLLEEVRGCVRIPIAVKLSPFFTNLAHLARRLDQAGASGLVLFNRFNQPDIDLATLQVRPRVTLSSPADPSAVLVPLRWIGVLYGRIQASLAASGGVHTAQDALKLILAGADVTMLASELLTRGIQRLSAIREDLVRWMEAHGYASVRQLRGILSQQSVAAPALFERAHYVCAVSSLGYLAPAPLGPRRVAG